MYKFHVTRVFCSLRLCNIVGKSLSKSSYETTRFRVILGTESNRLWAQDVETYTVEQEYPLFLP